VATLCLISRVGPRLAPFVTMLPKQLKYSTFFTVLIYHNPYCGRLFWHYHCLTSFHIHFHSTVPSNCSCNSQFCKLLLPYHRILHVMYVPLCAYSIYMTVFRQTTPTVPTDICISVYLYSAHFPVCAAHGTNVNSESNWVILCAFQQNLRPNSGTAL
jgi:hypothetical protein